MVQVPHRGQWFWETFDPAKHSGADLAELRRGLGRDAGSIPGMWRHYRCVVRDEVAAHGWPAPELTAEHAALSLFGVHQQSQRDRMHATDVPFGVAMRRLRGSGTFSVEAVDRRMTAAATATSVTELVSHLRGLISQLRSSQPAIPLDYNQLVNDLYAWDRPDRRGQVRRRWGAQYHVWTDQTHTTEPADPQPSTQSA